jgi:hypothetical protein
MQRFSANNRWQNADKSKTILKKRGKMMSTDQHKKEAPKKVNCKVITVSDTRTKKTDKSGSPNATPIYK